MTNTKESKLKSKGIEMNKKFRKNQTPNNEIIWHKITNEPSTERRGRI